MTHLGLLLGSLVAVVIMTGEELRARQSARGGGPGWRDESNKHRIFTEDTV